MTGQRSANRKGFGPPATVDTDELAKVTNADTTADYLNSKIVAGSGISKSVLNPGANETLQISAAVTADELAKVTNADTTASYLNTKIVVGSGLSKAVLNPGANETLQLSASGVAASNLPQWIPAGAWTADPANSQNALTTVTAGASPGSTYSIFTVINFPQVSVGGAQYWYFPATPPTGWSSNQLQFKVHFIVEDTISLPGGYRFTLGVRRQNDSSVIVGAKTTGNVDYTLADSNIPRYRYTALSSAITLASAVAGEGVFCELTRGTNPTSDESDEAYVVGMELHWV